VILVALAIQWGAIDEVGMAYSHVGGDSEATIGGSALQKISSCLTTLDLFLCQPHAILSACVLASANRGKSGSGAASLRDVVGHILGELAFTVSINCYQSLLIIATNSFTALVPGNPVELHQDSSTKSLVHSLLPLLILFAIYYWQDCLRRYGNCW